MKRRGILAAAGAALAGIVASRAAQPVAAAEQPVTYSDNPSEQSTNAISNGVYIYQNFNFNPAISSETLYVQSANATVDAIVGDSATVSGRAGVIGKGGPGDAGVKGIGGATNGPGIVGLTSNARDPGAGANNGVYGGANAGSVSGVYGQNDATNGYGLAGRCDQTGGVGTLGSSLNGIGVLGNIANGSTAANTVALKGTNLSSGAGGIGVQGTSTNGLGGSLQGGLAPLRLVPGTQSARTLSATGHQAGELYMTSDNRLFLFDGTNWREVLLAAPGSGVPPAAAARASSVGMTTQPVEPAPPPRP